MRGRAVFPPEEECGPCIPWEEQPLRWRLFYELRRIVTLVGVGGTDSEGLFGPGCWVNRLVVLRVYLVLLAKLGGRRPDVSPTCIVVRLKMGHYDRGYYKLVVNMELVDHRVPDGVKLRGAVVVRQREVVAATIAGRVIGINPSEAVQWLVDVAKVVNQKAHRY